MRKKMPLLFLVYIIPNLIASKVRANDNYFTLQDSLTNQRADYIILLIHGFADSPDEMKLLGAYLHDNLFQIHYSCVAGHGTNLQDFGKSTWQEWYASVQDDYDSLAVSGKKIVAIGFSMGANLAMLLSLERKLDRMVLINPAIRIRSPWWVPFSIESFMNFSIGKLPSIPRFIKGDIHHKENLKYRGFYYDRYPTTAMGQLVLLMRTTRQKVSQMDTPCLIIQSRDDRVVDYSSVKKMFDGLKVKDKKMLTFKGARHLVLIDEGYERVNQAISEYLCSR